MLRGQYLNPTILEDDDGQGQRFTFTIGSPTEPKRFPKVPSDEGRKLMESGGFGIYDRRERPRKALARRLLDRELGLGGQKINQGLMAQVRQPESMLFNTKEFAVNDAISDTRDGHSL